VIFDGQMNLLQEAKRVGVQRFVPAEFMVDLKKISKDEDPLLSYRLRFRDEVKKSGLKYCFINVGMFYDTYFGLCKDYLCYFGNNTHQKMDMISATDASKYIVAVISDPNRTGEFNFAAEEVSAFDIAGAIRDVWGGSVDIERKGDFDCLRKIAMEYKQQGNLKEATNSLIALHAFDGSGKLSQLDNSKFTDITPISLVDYLKLNKGKINLDTKF